MLTQSVTTGAQAVRWHAAIRKLYDWLVQNDLKSDKRSTSRSKLAWSLCPIGLCILASSGVTHAGSLNLNTNVTLIGCDYSSSGTPFRNDPFGFQHEFVRNLPFEEWDTAKFWGLRSRAEQDQYGGKSINTLLLEIATLTATSTYDFARSYCAAAPGAHPSTSVFGTARGENLFSYSDRLQFFLDPNLFPATDDTTIAASVRFTLFSETDRVQLAGTEINYGQYGGVTAEKRLMLSAASTGQTEEEIFLDGSHPAETVRSFSVPLYSGPTASDQNTYHLWLFTETNASSAASGGQQPSVVLNDSTRVVMGPLPTGITCTSSSTRFPGCERSAALLPLKVRDTGLGAPVPYAPHVQLDKTTAISDASPVGAIEEISGTATVTRADGTVEILTVGTPIYEGDIISTESDGDVRIAFIDETSMDVSANARMSIEEYSTDPSIESTSDTSIIRGFFLWTSGLIGRDDPDDINVETPIGGGGIRADAADYNKGVFGIETQNASPVGVSAYVSPPPLPSTVSFNVALLNDSGTFSARFGGVEKLTLDAADTSPGLPQSHSFVIDPATMGPATSLEFVYDAPTGNQMVLWDIKVGDVALDRESLFGRLGQGTVSTVRIVTPDEATDLTQQVNEARTRTLQSNRWEMITIPAVALQDDTTVEDLFGDDLPTADHESKWNMWGYDATTGSYYPMTPASTIAVGVAYWVIQHTGADLTLHLPMDLDYRNRSRSAQCPTGDGCYVIGLEKRANSNAISWNMIGSPRSAETTLMDTQIRYLANGAPGDVQAATYQNAQTRALISDTLWIYNASSQQYQNLSAADDLQRWQGAWLPVVGAGHSDLEWLVP